MVEDEGYLERALAEAEARRQEDQRNYQAQIDYEDQMQQKRRAGLDLVRKKAAEFDQNESPLRDRIAERSEKIETLRARETGLEAAAAKSGKGSEAARKQLAQVTQEKQLEESPRSSGAAAPARASPNPMIY